MPTKQVKLLLTCPDYGSKKKTRALYGCEKLRNAPWCSRKGSLGFFETPLKRTAFSGNCSFEQEDKKIELIL